MALPTLDMMKGWVEDLSAKNRALEEENKSLKCTIVTLTRELEMERMANGNTSVNVEAQVNEVNGSPEHRKKLQSESDVDMNNGQQIPRVTTSTGIVSDNNGRGEDLETNETKLIKSSERPRRMMLRRVVSESSESDLLRSRQIPAMIRPVQIEGTSEKSTMSGSGLPMSSEDKNTPFGDISVKEEPDDELVQNNHQTGTPSMEEESEIDIKEEDVGYGYGQSKQDCTHNPILVDTLNGDQSSDMPIKHEIQRSIQRMFCSADQVSNNESVLGDFGTEAATDSGLNPISSSNLTKKLICPKLVKPLPQVTRSGLRGQKKKQPPLTTRPAKIIQCKNCSAAFDNGYKLMKHNEDGKCKAPFNCPNCGKSFGTERVFTNHLKTHTGEKKKQSTSVRIDKELRANRKRSLTVENKKGKPGGRPKKQRIVVEAETTDCNVVAMPLGGEMKHPPCVVEKNPLKEEKILGIILSNLGKHDLLKARLVSHDWNVESLKVLEKSNFTQLLNGSRIKEYLLFIMSNESRPLIIPFHLNFFISLSPVYFSIINPILTSHVDSLCQIFGPNCVSTLTLRTHDTYWTERKIKKIGLIECLALIAPGLKTLDLTLTRLRSGNDFLQNQTITFPKLKKLVCNTRECKSERGAPDLTYISIIENSPKLEDLTLTHTCDLDSWPLKFNQLKSLSLHSMFKPQNILDKILSSSGPPVLRELSIGFCFFESRSAEDKIVVHNILKGISPTLKSLKFRGDVIPTNAENVRYPKLPHLEHLGLEYDFGSLRRPDDENFNISPENFPSLKSIELPIGFIFTSPTVQSEEIDGDRMEFPNLIKITLRVRATDGPRRVDEPLEQLQQIFPTPSKLCLVNVGGHGFVKYVLFQIMKSNWSKSFQEIEMIGFNQDCLGGVMNRLELSPRVDLEEWYLTLEESMKTEVKNSLKRIRMEFEETVGFGPPGSIILRRTNQLDCQIKK